MVSEFGSSTITHAGVLKDGITLLNLNQTGWLPSNVAYVQFSDVAPLASDTTVDLSKDNDGTVLGWQRSTTYFVYRIDKEPVVANPNSSWLYKSGTYQWTVSPYSDSRITYEVFDVYYNGQVDTYQVRYGSGVRPVLYLRSGIKLQGSGGSDDPYEIIE